MIGSFGTFAESGSFGGELNGPRDVAANETGIGPAGSGDTYVADEGNNRIDRFDSAGRFLGAWGKDTIAPTVDERQRLVVRASAGELTLTFKGSTTTPLVVGSLYGFLLREKLEALPSIGQGNVAVAGEGTFANPFVVTFTGALGGADQPALTADTSRLSGSAEISTIADGTSTTADTGEGFEVCTVAAQCKAGVGSGEAGALESPQSVAVDQDTGDVYVSDRGNRRIDEYDGIGHFIRAFGFDVAESGPGDAGTGYEVCAAARDDVCKAGVPGPGVGQYGEGFAEHGFGIAVAPADGDAAAGTVYLADSGNRRVDTYGLDGSAPDSFGSAAQFGEEQPRSVAVDDRGIVYASDSGNKGDVERYDSKGADGEGIGFLAPIVPSADEVQEIAFVGFATGDRFRLTCPDGTATEKLAYAPGETGTQTIKNGLERACGTGNVAVAGETPAVTVTFIGALGGADQPPMTCAPIGRRGSCSVTTVEDGYAGPLLPGNPPSATLGLAVDPDGTALYVLRARSNGPIVVQEFGPAHEPGLAAPPSAADDTDAEAANLTSAVQGFGLDAARGRLYLSVAGDPDGYEGEGRSAPLPQAHRVYTVAAAGSLPSPTVDTPSVTDVAARSVTFHGQVDPMGGFVSCSFQYSTDGTNWTDVPVQDCLSLDQDGGVQEIVKSFAGLVPDTHYFYRLRVTRPYFADYAPVTSATGELTTPTAPPVVAGAALKTLDEGSVLITATVDPSHSPTTYVVQYGTTPALGSATGPVSVGDGTAPVEISPVIGGLAPATDYYFKIVATNLVGSGESPLLSVRTFPAAASFGPCPNERFRTGPSVKLPDCRAYEQVTPTDKYGSDAYGGPSTVQASAAGDAITFYTFSAFPGSTGFQYANFFQSSFDGNEWSTAGLNPPPAYGDDGNVLAWTPDLRLSFANADDFEEPGGFKLVMRDAADGSRTVLVPESTGATTFVLGGASDGDSEVAFEADGRSPVNSGPVPASTEGNVYLFDRRTGQLTLAGLLPDSACGAPPCVPAAGTAFPKASAAYVQDAHDVSATGIYFLDRGTGDLYLRRDPAGLGATTVNVAASPKTTGGGPAGVATNSPQPARFEGATVDGSRAFFESTEELTDDANTGPEPLLTPAIGRAGEDGSSPQPNFIPTRAKWTAVDGSHIYWSDTAAGTIGRAAIDGTGADPEFITGLDNPEGIAVDAGHVYWAEARDGAEGTGTIGRATLAGGSVEREFIVGAADPHGVAVNAEYIYWTNGASTDIGRATIAGAGPEESFIARGESEHPWGIAADATHLYFTQQEGSSSIYEYTLDGQYAGFLGPSDGVGEEARGLAVDSGHVYWAEMRNGRVGRAALDLTAPDPDLVTGAYGIFGVAAGGGHVYWATDPAPDERPAGLGNDLYRYDAATGGLVDLAPDGAAPNGAQVVGVVGYSRDGSSVYFAANGDLDGGGPAGSGNCVQGENVAGFSGSCSIYLWQEDGTGGCATAGGCVRFVAPADAEGYAGDDSNWTVPAGNDESAKTSRVSADGQVLVFRSQIELTGYGNVAGEAACGNGVDRCPQFFRFDAASGQISCLTCNPTGAPPRGIPNLKNPDLYHAPSSHAITSGPPFLSRNLSPDGDRFFFQSADKLVPADVDGEVSCASDEEVERGTGPSCRDVYEWEAAGTPGGSCTTDSSAYSQASGGCLYLLSAGTGIYPSYLADVSESGETAFIFSRGQLVPADEDNLQDLYAVKVDGGLASQNAARPAPCEGDACGGTSSAPPDVPGAGSSVFEGPGNPRRGTDATHCGKHRRAVRRKGKVRCVRKQAKHPKHKRHRKNAKHAKRRSRSGR